MEHICQSYTGSFDSGGYIERDKMDKDQMKLSVTRLLKEQYLHEEPFMEVSMAWKSSIVYSAELVESSGRSSRRGSHHHS